MSKRPYLYALLGGLITVGFLWSQNKPMAPLTHLDDRLDVQLAEKLTGIPFAPSKNELLQAGFGIDFKIPLSPPEIYLGFDKPPSGMNPALFRRDHFRLVGAFHSIIPPIQSISELASLTGVKIYTDDELLYARFRQEAPNLEFRKDSDVLLASVASDVNTLALISTEKINLRMRTLSEPIDVSLWLGWRRSTVPFADRLKVNDDLDRTIGTLLKKTNLSTEPAITKIVAVGDIMLGRKIGKRMEKEMKSSRDAKYPFGGTYELLKNADITIGNLECAISNRGKPMPEKDYTFRANPKAIQQLTSAGFDILTLGNNHSKDYGETALLDTLDQLKKAGIETIGAGRNRTEARMFKVLTTADGTRVGFLGYSGVTPKSFVADAKTGGIASTKERGLAKDIKTARAKCDILMVQYHWGTEYTVNPTKEQRALAHRTIDLGADIVIGHHPHWIQEVEFYKDKFIAYSLGNFVFDMNHRPKVTEGLVVTCDIRNKKIIQIHCDPVSIKNGEPEIISWEKIDRPRDRKTILEEIFAASFLTRASVKPDKS